MPIAPYPYPYVVPYTAPYPAPVYYPPAPAYPYSHYPGPYEALPPAYPSPAAPAQPSPTPPPAAPPDAALQIEVMPEETEIVIDGTRVGLAEEFHGHVPVPVMAGPHVVDLHWREFSVTETIVASPRTTVLIKRNLGPSTSATPQTPPPAASSPPPD